MYLVISILCFLGSADASLGETPLQFAHRHGTAEIENVTKSRQKHFPLAPKGPKLIEKLWVWKGWEIKAVFLDIVNGAASVQYRKLPGSQSGQRLDKRELKALLDGNLGSGQKWEEDVLRSSMVKNTGTVEKLVEGCLLGAAGAKVWNRKDGIVATLIVGGSTLQICDPRVMDTAKPAAGPVP